ncbi:MAG: hypothetical protein J5704_00470 [Paludibacteraceae bacterium]|nr:hypothetical protein [Paludibacteraceae bacterium]
MRTLLDKILRASIKLCLLTGVAFTVTACYGVKEPPDYYEPQRQADQQQLEQQLEQSTTTTDQSIL